MIRNTNFVENVIIGTLLINIVIVQVLLINYTNIVNKEIVCIYPGKSDILYCVDNDNKDANEFRYTQDSRRKECKIKKYGKIILKFKKEKIDNKTIIDYETELSKLNRKTLIIKDFKEYIKKKSEINNKLYNFI